DTEDRNAARPGRQELEQQMLFAVGADPDDPPWGVRLGTPAPEAGPARVRDLRHASLRAVLSLAGRDLGDGLAADEVASELADIAGAVLTAGLALAIAEQTADAGACRLAGIATGKGGWPRAKVGQLRRLRLRRRSGGRRSRRRSRPGQRYAGGRRADADLRRGRL